MHTITFISFNVWLLSAAAASETQGPGAAEEPSPGASAASSASRAAVPLEEQEAWLHAQAARTMDRCPQAVGALQTLQAAHGSEPAFQRALASAAECAGNPQVAVEPLRALLASATAPTEREELGRRLGVALVGAQESAERARREAQQSDDRRRPRARVAAVATGLTMLGLMTGALVPAAVLLAGAADLWLFGIPLMSALASPGYLVAALTAPDLTPQGGILLLALVLLPVVWTLFTLPLVLAGVAAWGLGTGATAAGSLAWARAVRAWVGRGDVGSTPQLPWRKVARPLVLAQVAALGLVLATAVVPVLALTRVVALAWSPGLIPWMSRFAAGGTYWYVGLLLVPPVMLLGGIFVGGAVMSARGVWQALSEPSAASVDPAGTPVSPAPAAATRAPSPAPAPATSGGPGPPGAVERGGQARDAVATEVVP